MTDSTRTPDGGIALTPMQSWMFYDSVPAKRPWVNLQQAIVRFNAETITVAALTEAWNTVVALHPALRATIRWRNLDKPAQVIAPQLAVTVEELDWQDKPAEAQERALADFLAVDRQRGVDVETAPAWRVMLIRFAPTRSVMVWTAHNALIDGNSIGIVLEDLLAQLDTGAPISAPLPAEHYVAMCRKVGAPADPAAKPWFADYLDGFEPLGLAAGRYNDTTDWRATVLAETLDEALSDALRAAAARCGGTMRNLIEAAWGLMLARWYNAPDLVFGVTGGGRNLLAGGDRASGCFLNSLPRRMKVGRDSTLGEVIGRLRADTEAMRPFEQVSVAEIRKFCNLHGASYLFDTVVMFDRGSMTGLFDRAGAQARGRKAELHSEIDLPLSLAAYTDTAMRFELEADPAVVPAERARRMLAQLLQLFRAIAVAGPDTLLRELDMLGDEREEVLALGRPAQGTRPFDVLDRFREVVTADPGAVAVEEPGGSARLTYGALDAASDRLAAHLQAHGAKPGDIIAIRLGRRLDYFVALLAVLKSGAAFLPIDPSYPDAVIDHMLTDSGTGLVIADDGPPPPPGVTRVAPDAGTDGATPTSVTRAPDGPAYVIYTSGSTGKPKGVVIPDQAMMGHVQALVRLHDLTPSDRVFQFISLSFDFSLEEILPTLLTGATLVLRSEEAATAAPALLDEVAAAGITILNLPTAFFHIVGDYLTTSGATLPAGVRTVSFGGERANPQIVQDVLNAAPGVRLLNGYGPTETAISCTFFEPSGTLPEGDLPIGTATDHALCYIAAPDGSLSPRGRIGELWVGGVAVGLGYHGLPEKTADVFFDDHFRGEGRVYRSGDRASWRADGNLAFFGRNDRQVKVRGFRIDLGHVERVLEKAQAELRILAGVRDAGKPSARLLAWAMSPEGSDSVDLDALNALAESDLPPQMRPRIVVVDAFPRTAGGKVDLKALPDPGQDAATATSDAGPMSDVEAAIAAQMAEVLMLEAIGPEDDFYDLGGHSLLAAELVGRIEVNLGHKISVIDLRKNPTARGLAGVVETGSTGPRNIFPIQARGARPPLFAVHILGGEDSYYTGLATELGADQPILGVTVGTLARDKPIGIEETAKRYFDEIQKYHPDGPVHLAAVSLGAYFAWELAWMLHDAGREIGHFALFDADGPGGRDAHTGLAGLRATLRTVRHRGYDAIPTAIANRIEDMRHARISRRMQAQSEAGERIDIRDGTDFIASNDLAVANYQPKPLAVPFTVYRSNENFFDTPEAIRSGLGWEEVALAGYEVVNVPGGHLTMLYPPHVKVLARHMARAMKG